MLKVAKGQEIPETRLWKTRCGTGNGWSPICGRAKAANHARVICLRASAAGFGLYDQLRKPVLKPTCWPFKIPPRGRRRKKPGKDALQLLELVRAFVLAGNPLPAVWVPDAQTRDDRELVRTRLDVSVKIGLLKNQVKSLLKRNQVRRPAGRQGWTRVSVVALQSLVERAESP
jgi:transposase